MLKSICIKTNNTEIINYLLHEFENVNIENLYISNYKFKTYKNIIIHYKGSNLHSFYNTFSNIISSSIIKFYEGKIIKHILNCNYFYFTSIELKHIFNNAFNYINNNELHECTIRKKSIKKSCLDYFKNNKSVVLDGFVNFRLTNYIKILDYIVDISVNKFVIDREYSEFVELLKSYVNSKGSSSSEIHLIYNNHESVLLDESKNIINLKNNLLENNKIVSDISFSANDYALNTLLTLLPKKIYIHIIDNSLDDEFINTLKLIFDNRVFICNDCNICKSYKFTKTNKL